MTDGRGRPVSSGPGQPKPSRVLGPGPPRESLPRRLAGRLRREWRSLAALDDIQFWFVRVGALLLVAGGATFVCGAWRLGSFWDAYAVLIGIDDPQHSEHPFTALALSALGWIAAPALVGAVAGVVVERSITSHRNRSFKDL